MPRFLMRGAKNMPKVLGLFRDKAEAERAVQAMKELGVEENRISLVAKHQEGADVEAGREMGGTDSIADGTATGGAIGGIAGILAGAGLLAVPGLGPILAAGPLAAGLSGLAAGGVAGGLVDYGMDEETGQRYANELESGRILVGVEDAQEEKINEVTSVLKDSGAYDVTLGK
ncbi:hypothetical protein [Halonatronum saccharophilum]|uniref:hypothetical protein n=1 Tax=Halonatronum saccharophilum TaxID=150060 RepID=UPI0004B66033|nr:hypothetical protein [Halonatronum saccharophilum]